MTPTPPAVQRRRGGLPKRLSSKRLRVLQRLLAAVLLLWGLGLAVAAVRVAQWQRETVQVLVQLRADALLRASVLRGEEQVHPQWWQRRALALLGAIEQQRVDARWSWLVPGAWPVFDRLHRQTADRIGHEFGQVVVQAIERELESRAAALTGISLATDSAQLRAAAACRAPGVASAAASAAVEQSAEYVAMAHFVEEAAQLDDALTSLRALRTGSAVPEDLRRVVKVALGETLSGAASRTLLMFSAPGAAGQTPSHEALRMRMNAALRCSLYAGMQTLKTGLLTYNPLITQQEALARVGAPAQWFDAGSHSPNRLRTIHAALSSVQAMLDNGNHAWMRDGQQPLGPAYAALLDRVARISLFDPQDASRLRAQAAQQQLDLRRRLQALLTQPGSGIEWQSAAGRFTLTNDQRAIYEGLGMLLREPFMAEVSVAPASMQSPDLTWRRAQRVRLEDVTALAAQRRRFVRDILPRFPAALRPAVARYVDDRIAQLALERGRKFLAQTTPVSSDALLAPVMDSPDLRLSVLEAALHEAGAPALALRVRDGLVAALPPTQPMGASGRTYIGEALVIIDVLPQPAGR